jgi:hypothetical protein
MGIQILERDQQHPDYTDDLKRDAAAINAVLDQEATAEIVAGELQILLRDISPEPRLTDRQLVNMIYFAKEEHQALLRWRACRAHVQRLGCLDLRNPMKEFDNLARQMSPAYGPQAARHKQKGRASLLNEKQRGRMKEADLMQAMLQAELNPDVVGAELEKPSKLHTTPYVNTTRLFEQTAILSSAQGKSPRLRPTKRPATQAPGPQTVISPTRGHMPYLAQRSIDPSLTKGHQQLKLNSLIVGAQQTNVSSPIKAVAPTQTHLEPLGQSSPEPSLSITHPVLDPIVDPRALFLSEQRLHAGLDSSQHQQLQSQPRAPTHQQPVSLQAILKSTDRVNPEWLVWRATKRKEEEEQAREAERKERLRAEILAEIATGADVLAYRFREYNEVVHKQAEGEVGSAYHQNLLANKIIAHDDQSEDARVVRFAKSRWWNYWTKDDKDIAKEAMKKAVQGPLGLEGEMRGGGHLITQADMSVMRREAKSYDSGFVGE